MSSKTISDISINSGTAIVPVILSGGSGSRLWPVSRPERPKQLLSLTASRTMLQLTVERLAGYNAGRVVRPILVANAMHEDLIAEQLSASAIEDYLVVLEPCARNTAPAIALAALAAEPHETLLVMPSDHVIGNLMAFHKAIAQAQARVNEGWLVTFGITPDSPETGYGYIRMGAPYEDGTHIVERFVEKPDHDHAVKMLEQGDHAWNAGIFMFRADAFIAALRRHRPQMMIAVENAMSTAVRRDRFLTPDAAAFEGCPSDSVDYAIMECEERVVCVPVDMGWSDVGSWDSLHGISSKDQSGNAVRGEALTLGANNCLIHSDGPRVTLVDVKDLIVVVSQNDVMVLRRGESQKVRKVTQALAGFEASEMAPETTE